MAATAYSQTLELLDTLKNIEAKLKEDLKRRAIESGEKTESGGYLLHTDEWTVPVTVHTPGGTLDDKKVEAALRAQGKKPKDFMEEKVTYKAVRERLAPLFSPEDIKACEKEAVYSLQKPRRVVAKGTMERVDNEGGGEE